MALVKELEKQGNFLFKYRGQFPIILFVSSFNLILIEVELVIDDWVFSWLGIIILDINEPIIQTEAEFITTYNIDDNNENINKILLGLTYFIIFL